jgi:hypothetical protein
MLKRHLDKIYWIMIASKNMEEFKTNLHRAFPNSKTLSMIRQYSNKHDNKILKWRVPLIEKWDVINQKLF